MTVNEVNRKKEELVCMAKNLSTLRNWCSGVGHQDLVTQVEESSGISTTLYSLLNETINCVMRETNRLDTFMEKTDIGNI